MKRFYCSTPYTREGFTERSFWVDITPKRIFDLERKIADEGSPGYDEMADSIPQGFSMVMEGTIEAPEGLESKEILSLFEKSGFEHNLEIDKFLKEVYEEIEFK